MHYRNNENVSLLNENASVSLMSFRCEMDVFDSRYYEINKVFLSWLGQWVFQSKIKKYLGRCVIFFSLITALFFQFSFLFAAWGTDIDGAFECFPSLTLSVICFFQLCVYCVKEEKLLILVKCIKSDWKLWLSGVELKILSNYAEKGRGYTLLYAGYVYGTIVTFVAASLVPIFLDIVIPLNETRPKQFVYPAIYPIDHDKYINWILVHGSFTAFYNLLVLFSTEAMLAVTTQHACGLFAIISYRLRNVLKIIDPKIISSEENRNELLYQEMRFSIQYHTYAIRYSKILRSLYSPFLFFTVGGNIITTSVVLVQALNSLDSMAHAIKFGSLAAAIIFHIFVLSLPAQNLLDQSSKVSSEACKECWYNMPAKSKKLLVLIILQSSRPCRLTAGKIVPIDMLTFSQILKTSISYFTVLSSLR